MAETIKIVGHKNPDNDSIAAAVSYAYLKNALEAKKDAPEANYVACCLGPLPQESATILERTGLPTPELISSVAAGEKVILVDHNELTQAVDGLEEAEVVEVIDHHRISGNVTTGNPILYMNVPVGSTATIVSGLYELFGVEITPAIAEVLLSAIMTDTVITKSPTCTGCDLAQADKLGAIIGKKATDFGLEVFQMRGGDNDLSVEELCTHDSKEFKKGDATYLVAQHETVTLDTAMEREQAYREFLAAQVAEKGYEFALLLVTDIFNEGSRFICEGDVSRVSEAFGIDATKAEWVPGILSRKKQVIPPLS
ncbi:MAG: manganese-dependent inorganic pyrophosphatase [Coriobacteriia bacterium]|nr:manganese-dependent inorganic pyrophosphatase [Coriobacteriia bacterium]